MRATTGPWLAFLAIGVAFIAIGITTNRVYLGVGVVFLVLGAALRGRSKGGV